MMAVKGAPGIHMYIYGLGDVVAMEVGGHLGVGFSAREWRGRMRVIGGEI